MERFPYENVNINKPRSHSDFNALKLDWNDSDFYEISKKIGQGKYSEVYQGKSLQTKTTVAVKILKPVKKKKVFREIKILRTLQSCSTVISLQDIARDKISHTPCLIFEYIANESFRSFYRGLTDFEVRFYIYEILKTLNFAHSEGIMHRDIKPQNILIDHSKRTLKVADWGLADFYYPNRDYNVRVASRFYKAPELLVNDTKYSYALDMWSLGVMLAGIVFKNEPFFKGIDNADQLIKITKVLGTQKLIEYLQRFDLNLEPEVYESLRICDKINLNSFINSGNSHLVSQECIGFLEACLVYDHTERITSQEALLHPYFWPVVKMHKVVENKSCIYKHGAPEYETIRRLLPTKSNCVII